MSTRAGPELLQAVGRVRQRPQPVRELVGQRVTFGHARLLERGQPILTQAGLREAGQGRGQVLGASASTFAKPPRPNQGFRGSVPVLILPLPGRPARGSARLADQRRFARMASRLW